MTAEPIAYAPARPEAPRLYVVPAPPPYVPVPICVCGHEPDTHDASDPCSVCGPVRCRSYRRRTGRGARRR